jgi:hypothetical protein
VDYIKLAGALVRREALEHALAQYSDLFDDYRAELWEDIVNGSPKGTITLRLWRSRGPVTDELVREMSEKISRILFLTPNRTLAELVVEGDFRPLQVHFESAPFPHGHKDVKLFLRNP